MTGVHDKRATQVQAKPESSASPRARRTRLDNGAVVPPPKSEPSAPAPRVARSPSPPYGERDPENVTAAPPPAARRGKRAVAPVPPPKVEASAPAAWAPPRRIAYNLRNRLVPDTSNRKPITQGNETNTPGEPKLLPPSAQRPRRPVVEGSSLSSPSPPLDATEILATLQELQASRELPPVKNVVLPSGEELEHDLSCSFLEEPKHDKYWKAPECARVGLEQYNRRNQGDEYELVRAVNSNVFIFNGIWLHANFLAKRKSATSCVDLVPEYFFAELEFDGDDLLCASCTKLNSVVVDPKNSGYCEVCPKNIMHPVDGYHGHWKAKRLTNRHAAGGLKIAFSS